MRLAYDLAAGIGWAFPLAELSDPIGLAVSGGGDSIGLLYAVQDWAVKNGRVLKVATVDHGLRDASRSEAEFVADVCAGLGVAHDILTWTDAPQGNLQAAARGARYDLLTDWAKTHALSCVLLGHTHDDQAETFLMRLARGSGVDGLAGMRGHRRWNGVLWGRPLLDTTRAEIREYLKERGAKWVDDPSNEDTTFDRVKARAVLDALEPLGISRKRLIETAFHMSMARDALVETSIKAAKSVVEVQHGDVVIDMTTMYRTLPADVQLRLISAGLCFVSSNHYRPRYSALNDLYCLHGQGKPRTLHGCLVTGGPAHMRITREVNAVAKTTCASDKTWDSRWAIDGPHSRHLNLRALGDHIKDVPDWRETGVPRTSLMASPAVFDGETLIAAPVAGLRNGFEACIVTDFASFLLSR